MDLPLIWVFIVGFAVLMYIICDGFDLGVGIVFPWIPNEHRPTAMTTVSPVWDGNETWLIMGAAMLYGAFPIAYSLLLPDLYIPLIFMLMALIFRGVAFEFLFKANKKRILWDISFTIGSWLTTFMQGMVLGTFIQGPIVINGQNLSGPLHWLTPFSVFTGISLVIGYGFLGAAWLILKTSDELQEWCYKLARNLLILWMLVMVAITIWTPYIDPFVIDRWFGYKRSVWVAIIPLFAATAMIWNFIEIKRRQHEKRPFILGIFVFVCAFAGLAISSLPYIVPHTITFRAAAADSSTLLFLLIGTLVVLPIILVYFSYTYYVFRGKVTSHHELH